MPLPTLVRSYGFEPHSNALLEVSPSWSRTTSNFSPRGGVAGAVVVGTVLGTSAGRLQDGTSIQTIALGDRHAISFDFRVNSGTIDCPLFTLQGLNGTGQVMTVYFDQAGDVLLICQNNGISGKGSTLATGALTITAGTWYRLWVAFLIPAGGGTNNVEIEVRVEAATTDSHRPTAVDCSASTSNQSNTAWVAYVGGNHGSSLGIGQSLTVDNIGYWEDTGAHEEYYVSCVAATINGNGTDNDFNVVNDGADTQRWEAVDEATPNGSGTTDVDYIWIDSTSANEQTFTVTWTQPTGYDRPMFVQLGLWHRNADGGKWAADHKRRYRFYSGTVIDDSAGNLSDPGGSYVGGTITAPKALDGNPLQITGLEVGVAMSAAGAEAARWQISTFGCELTFMRPVSFVPKTRRSMRHQLVR